jgi:hypothetical protein
MSANTRIPRAKAPDSRKTPNACEALAGIPIQKKRHAKPRKETRSLPERTVLSPATSSSLRYAERAKRNPKTITAARAATGTIA